MRLQEFFDAIKQRFAAIDVKRTQSLVKRGKTPEEALDIHNEIKIIISDDSTFALWSEVIASHSQGEFLDSETNSLKKFKENKNWRPEKEGVLNQEFFKWLGNLTEAYHRKFCKHILNRSGESHVYAYPKVTMKTISSVLIGCYNAKDWIEQRKRKQLVQKELHNLKPRLQLFSTNGEFSRTNWKTFKRNYNVNTPSSSSKCF
jgi:CRISPR/Cas system CSM-associated protein Csm2 small subunit